MIRSFKERRDSDEGFTLIELMVVVLIIGILLAIAVPTFLNAQENAKTKAATSNLRSALSAVKTVYADQQTYATSGASVETITLSEMRLAEPSLEWQAVAASSNSAEKISWTGTASKMGLATRSAPGFCFYIIDSVASDGTGGTRYGKTAAGDNATCTASHTEGSEVPAAVWGDTPKAAGW